MKKGLEMLTVGFSPGWVDSGFVKAEQSKGPSQSFLTPTLAHSQPLFKGPYELHGAGLPKMKLGFEFDFHKSVYKKNLIDFELSGSGYFLKIRILDEVVEACTIKKSWEAELF